MEEKTHIDFTAELFPVIHGVLKRNSAIKKFTNREMMSQAFDDAMLKKYGQEMEWRWKSPNKTYGSKAKEHTKRPYYRSIGEVLNKIKAELKAHYQPMIENESGNTNIAYQYPSGINYEFFDRWIYEQSKEYDDLRKKALLNLLASSEGLIHLTWLAKDILKQYDDEKRKIISFDSNLNLWNISLIPTFYKSIEKRMVLIVDYYEGYRKEKTIIFHPHFLKEYNNRWFIFGMEEGKPNEECQLAIDRVINIRYANEEKAYQSITYTPATTDYSNYFDDIVGVRHPKDKNHQRLPAKKIEIEVCNYNAYKRIITKPLHKSQQIGRDWEWTDENKGSAIIEITVVPNPELISQLLSYGSFLRVMPTADGYLEQRLAEHVREMMGYYQTNNQNNTK